MRKSIAIAGISSLLLVAALVTSTYAYISYGVFGDTPNQYKADFDRTPQVIDPSPPVVEEPATEVDVNVSFTCKFKCRKAYQSQNDQICQFMVVFDVYTFEPGEEETDELVDTWEVTPYLAHNSTNSNWTTYNVNRDLHLPPGHYFVAIHIMVKSDDETEWNDCCWETPIALPTWEVKYQSMDP